MRPEDNPADEAYERDLLLHEIRLLTRVREAAERLLAKMKRIQESDAYKSVWTIAQLHHAPYTGENWGEELCALEAALAQGGRES